MLFGSAVQTPTMFVLNRFTNLHVHSRHVTAKTSVATEEFNRITLASSTEPVNPFTKVSLSVFIFRTAWRISKASRTGSGLSSPGTASSCHSYGHVWSLTGWHTCLTLSTWTLTMDINHRTVLRDHSKLSHLSFPKAFWSKRVGISRADQTKTVSPGTKHRQTASCVWPCHVWGLLPVLLLIVPSVPTPAIPVESRRRLKVQRSGEQGQMFQCPGDLVVSYQWQFPKAHNH